jgi:hypothetical protein
MPTADIVINIAQPQNGATVSVPFTVLGTSDPHEGVSYSMTLECDPDAGIVAITIPFGYNFAFEVQSCSATGECELCVTATLGSVQTTKCITINIR